MPICSVQKIEVLSRQHYRPLCGSPAPKTGDCTRRQTGKGGRPRCPRLWQNLTDYYIFVVRPPYPNTLLIPFNALTYQPKKVWHDDSCRDPRTPPKRGSRGFSRSQNRKLWPPKNLLQQRLHCSCSCHALDLSKPHICLTGISQYFSGFNMDSSRVLVRPCE